MKCELKQDSCVLAKIFSFMLRLDNITLLPRKRNRRREGGGLIYILLFKLSVDLRHLHPQSPPSPALKYELVDNTAGLLVGTDCPKIMLIFFFF